MKGFVKQNKTCITVFVWVGQVKNAVASERISVNRLVNSRQLLRAESLCTHCVQSRFQCSPSGFRKHYIGSFATISSDKLPLSVSPCRHQLSFLIVDGSVNVRVASSHHTWTLCTCKKASRSSLTDFNLAVIQSRLELWQLTFDANRWVSVVDHWCIRIMKWCITSDPWAYLAFDVVVNAVSNVMWKHTTKLGRICNTMGDFSFWRSFCWANLLSESSV